MDAEGGKGLCIFCPRALPPPRLLHCGSKPCTQAYMQLYDMGKRAELAEARQENRTP